MGYRSYGCWVIKGPAEHINAAWVLCRLNIMAPAEFVTEYEGGLFGALKIYYVDDVGYIRLNYSDWKWYESYQDIQFFEAIWSLLEEYAYENPNTIYGKSIRIGEEDTDILTQSFGEDHGFVEIFVSRSIIDDEPAQGKPFQPYLLNLTQDSS